MTDQTTTADNTVVMGTDPATGQLKMDRRYAFMFPDGAANLALDHYKRQSQANLDRAVALSEAGEDEPDEENPPASQPVADKPPSDGAPAPALVELPDAPGGVGWVASDKALQALSSACPAGAELVQSWGTDGATNVRMIQAVTGALLKDVSPGGVQSFIDWINGLDGPDYATVHNNAAGHGRMTAPRAGDPSSIRASTAKGNAMTTITDRPASEAQLRALDKAFYAAYDRRDREEAARIDVERQALGKLLHPGDIVNGMRTI